LANGERRRIPPALKDAGGNQKEAARRHEGAGVSLSISQTLVTRQGGTMAAASVPGHGSTFTIWLPEAA
jgi:signal transduction histidine kinase